MEAFFLQLAEAGFAKELVVFISSMFPIWELKGAIILAQAWGIAPWTSFFICYVGSTLAGLIVLFFLRPVMQWMYRRPLLSKVATWIQNRGVRKSDKVTRYATFGLFLFVAVPLPTTGVWTGSLIATVLDMPLKKSVPAVVIGNVVAGLAIMLLYGVFTLV